MSKTTQTSANGTAAGLNKPQVRILQTLAKAKHSMLRGDVAAASKVDLGWITGYLSKACKANKGPSLVERKLARSIEVDVDGKKEVRFEITAAGRKELAKVEKAAAAAK